MTTLDFSDSPITTVRSFARRTPLLWVCCCALDDQIDCCTALNSKCGQCHDDSRRRKLNTDLLHVQQQLSEARRKTWNQSTKV